MPSVLTSQATHDAEALKMKFLTPGERTLFPVHTPADGDCLLHCVELLTKMTAQKISVRIAVELALHSDKYLDDHFMQRGHAVEHQLLVQYCIF